MLIPHRNKLFKGEFLARYDRFIARIRLDGQEIDAHCVNTGRMEGMIKAGSAAWVSRVPAESKRKLRYTLELLEVDGVITGANTQVPNSLAEALIGARQIPGLKQYSSLQREVRYGERSRIDLLLEWGGRKHFVEVKNCHLVYPDGGAYFPDSVSERATGHLSALTEELRKGHRASVLFTVQRHDAVALFPSDLHDPTFAEAAREAHCQGVRFRAVSFDVTPVGFRYLGTLPVRMGRYSTEPLEPFRAALAEHSGWVRRPP